MPDAVFLALDYMVGVADQKYASDATVRAGQAVEKAREAEIPVVFTKVGYRSGHPEVSSRNRVFKGLLGTNRLVGNDSRLVDAFTPRNDEPVLDKKRFSAFSGSGLWTVVRASGTGSVVLCGLSTSGVVLSTALELIDADYDVTILSDACADPETGVHDAIMKGILGSRATILTVDGWTPGQAAGVLP